MNFGRQYLTNNEYLELGGSLQETPFNLLEYRARKEIDSVTSNRFKKIEEYPMDLKLCVYELVQELKKYNETGNKSSESVGSYSVTFDKPLSSEEKKILRNLIVSYLSEVKICDIPVLYRGVDVNDSKFCNDFVS